MCGRSLLVLLLLLLRGEPSFASSSLLVVPNTKHTVPGIHMPRKGLFTEDSEKKRRKTKHFSASPNPPAPLQNPSPAHPPPPFTGPPAAAGPHLGPPATVASAAGAPPVAHACCWHIL